MATEQQEPLNFQFVPGQKGDRLLDENEIIPAGTHTFKIGRKFFDMELENPMAPDVFLPLLLARVSQERAPMKITLKDEEIIPSTEVVPNPKARAKPLTGKKREWAKMAFNTVYAVSPGVEVPALTADTSLRAVEEGVKNALVEAHKNGVFEPKAVIAELDKLKTGSAEIARLAGETAYRTGEVSRHTRETAYDTKDIKVRAQDTARLVGELLPVAHRTLTAQEEQGRWSLMGKVYGIASSGKVSEEGKIRLSGIASDLANLPPGAPPTAEIRKQISEAFTQILTPADKPILAPTKKRKERVKEALEDRRALQTREARAPALGLIQESP